MTYLSTNFQGLAGGAAIGALAGASFGPVGCGAGAAIGAINGLLGAQVSYVLARKGLDNPLWKITQAVLSIFVEIGITKAIAGVTFKAASIFVGISVGYIVVGVLVYSIVLTMFNGAKKQTA